MSSDTTKPTIPQVIDRFRAYHDANPMWGSLHIVLDDNNTKNDDVDYCIQYAIDTGDQEGAELGRLLRRMSRTQRLKLGRIA